MIHFIFTLAKVLALLGLGYYITTMLVDAWDRHQ